METIYEKDTSNKKMNITREFAAPLQQTWKAWTDPKLLDQWWAPKPWKAETKSMDFKEGGYWLYCMKGPKGEKQWAREDYKKIVPFNYFIGEDSFCDENGNKTNEMPGMNWQVKFLKSDVGTKVEVQITFQNEKDIQTIMDTGFQEGFTAAHGNLDELLKKTKTMVA